MELRFGGGVPEVLLDLTVQEFFVYGSGEQAGVVHARYGGHQFYGSRSGLSGAGWIPRSFGLREMATYRVDHYYVEGPPLDKPLPLTLPGGESVLVPVTDRVHLAHDWPIVVVGEGYGWRDWQLMLLDQASFFRFLRGDMEGLEEREENFRYVLQPGGQYDPPEYHEWKAKFLAPKGAKLNKYRRAIAGLFPLQFNAGEEEWDLPDAEFWRHLGIIAASDGRLYKVARKVCYQWWEREELSTTEALQEAAPVGTKVLAPNLYLQEDGHVLTLAGFLPDEGCLRGAVTLPEVMELLSGDEESRERISRRVFAARNDYSYARW